MILVTKQFIDFFQTFGKVTDVQYCERCEPEQVMGSDKYDVYFTADISIELKKGIGAEPFYTMEPLEIGDYVWHFASGDAALHISEQHLTVHLMFNGVAVENLEPE